MNINDEIIIEHFEEINFIDTKYKYYLAKLKNSKITIQKEITKNELVDQPPNTFNKITTSKIIKYTINENCIITNQEIITNPEINPSFNIYYFTSEIIDKDFNINDQQNIFIMSYNILFKTWEINKEDKIKKFKKLIESITKYNSLDFIGLQEIGSVEDFNKIKELPVLKDMLIARYDRTINILHKSNIILYDKKYGVPDYKIITKLFTVNGNKFSTSRGRNSTMVIFKKYKLCIINLHLGHSFAYNILINIRLIEEQIKSYYQPNLEEIIDCLANYKIIIMGDFNHYVEDFYIFTGLLGTRNIYRKIYNNVNNRNRNLITCSGFKFPVDFIFSTEKSPLCFNIYNNDWLNDRYNNNNSISDHKAIYALIDRPLITESINRTPNNKFAVFDFDGVLHTYVRPDEARTNWKIRQIHPINLSDIINYPFVKVLTKLIDLYYSGYTIAILTAQHKVTKSTLQNNILNHYCPNIINEEHYIFSDTTFDEIKKQFNIAEGVENPLSKSKSKLKKQHVLKIIDAEIYFEDSCVNISLVWNYKIELPSLKELYICNPFREIRNFNNFTVPGKDFKNILDQPLNICRNK